MQQASRLHRSDQGLSYCTKTCNFLCSQFVVHLTTLSVTERTPPNDWMVENNEL